MSFHVRLAFFLLWILLLALGEQAQINDFPLSDQQQNEEQQSDNDQQLQLREVLDDRLQRRTDVQWEIMQQLRQLQMNMTAEFQRMNQNVNVELHMQEKCNPIERILVQQHYGGSQFFSKTWNEFKFAFGHVDGNYWIGNERLHQLTMSGRYKLRFDILAKHDNQWYWAEYSRFIVHHESSGYLLNIGGYTGNAGDSMACVDGMRFTTKDKDQDLQPTNCAVTYGGGFWYRNCGEAMPNSAPESTSGFIWYRHLAGSDWAHKKMLYIRMTLISR